MTLKDNNWKDANLELPERQDEGECSDDVLVYGKEGFGIAFYDYAYRDWIFTSDLPNKVTHWQELPVIP